jgi:hypothetical protein
MAGLQKTLDVSPTIAARPGAAPANNAGAQLLQGAAAVAGAAKTFIGNKKKEEFEDELDILGHEIASKRAGEEYRGVTSKLEQLRIGKDQDIYSDTYVQIATEKLLKEAIGKSPLFASELRQHAAETLGFDPTGAHIRSLYAKPPSGSKATFASKQLEQAQFTSDNLGIPVKTVLQLQAKALLTKQQADLVASQSAIGAYSRQDILSSTMREVDNYVMDVMGSVVQEVQSGGIQSPEQTIATVQAGMMAHKQALRDRYTKAGINPSSSELSKDMDQIDEQWGPILEVAKTGSLKDILANQSSSIASALNIEAMNVMGDVALMNAAGGQEAVKNYFLVQDKLDKPGALELLQKTNPTLARTVRTLDDAKRFSAEAYKKVMGVSPAFSPSNTPLSQDEEQTINTLADRVHRDVVTKGALDPEMKLRRLAHAKAHGQRYKMLGNYFQKGARQAASPEEVRFVTQTFKEEYPLLVDRIVSDMNAAKGTRDEYTIVLEGKTLTKKFTGKPFTSKPGKGPISNWTGAQSPTSLPITDGDLKRLQSFNDGLANGWGEDVGVRPLTFLGNTLTEINTMSEESFAGQEQLEQATAAWEAEPTMENWNVIREIDPDFAADVERAAGHAGGKTGESPNE